MEMIYIFGAGGFARETDVWFSGDAFVVENGSPYVGMKIHMKDVISEKQLLERSPNPLLRDQFIIAIGNPRIRRMVVEKLNGFDFPTIINQSCFLDWHTVRTGGGCIICAGSVLTTNVSLGGFVQVHTGCNIGHDVTIMSYTTVSPGVNISGKVTIGQNCFLGVGTSIIEKVTIVGDVIIGAGGVVIDDIKESGTYVGVPVRKIK